MNRVVSAILIWACFLLVSCQSERFQQEYNQGSFKITMNDTSVINFTGSKHLSWINYEVPEANTTTFLGQFDLDYAQFDSIAGYDAGIFFTTYAEVKEHELNNYFTANENFGFTISHPFYSGTYYPTFYGGTNLFIDQFSQARIKGYYYGDFMRTSDSLVVYTTCDFDFTP